MFTTLKRMLRAAIILGCFQGIGYGGDFPPYVVRFVYEAVGVRLPPLDGEAGVTEAPREERVAKQNATDASILLGQRDVNEPGEGGLTPLMRAVQAGDPERVRWLVGLGADINQRRFHRTLLVDAFYQGNTNMVRLLIRLNADTQEISNCRDDLLHAAVENSHHDLVKLLVQQFGASVLSCRSVPLRPPLAKAAEVDAEAMVNLLLSLGAGLDQEIEWRKSMPVPIWMWPVVKRQWKAAHILLSKKKPSLTADQQIDALLLASQSLPPEEALNLLVEELELDLNALKKNGEFLIHIGIAKNNEALVRFVVKKNPVEINRLTERGATPLQYAVWWLGETTVEQALRTLVELGANVNQPGDQGRTALHWAAQLRKFTALRYLIRRGANVCQVDASGRTALHCAVLYFTGGYRQQQEASLAIIDALIQENPAIVNIKDGRRKNPLELAVICGATRVIGLIKTKCPELFNPADLTLLNLAIVSGQKDTAEYLVDTIGIIFDWRDPRVWEIFYQRIINGILRYEDEKVRERFMYRGLPTRGKDLFTFLEELPVITFFTERLGGHINALGVDDQFPLERVFDLEGERATVMRFLVRIGANLNQIGPDEWTLLTRAVVDEDQERVKLLVEIGADIEQPDANEWSPLELAVRTRSFGMTRLLLQLGAGRKYSNIDRQRLLGIAESLEDSSAKAHIIELLQDIPVDNSDEVSAAPPD